MTGPLTAPACRWLSSARCGDLARSRRCGDRHVRRPPRAARRSRRPERVVLGLAVLGLLLFAIDPVVSAEQGPTIVALEVVHVAVAGALVAVVLPALRRSQLTAVG